MSISLIFIIIGVTVLVSFQGFSNHNLIDKYVYSPYLVKNRKESYRVLSHLLIHADHSHLLFNMLSLYFLGVHLENQFISIFGLVVGELNFLILYVLGGVFSTIIPFIRHQNNSYYQALGASGAVSAVIFAFIVLNPFEPLYFMLIPVLIPAYLFGLIYLGLEYFLDKKGKTGVAHDAHIGGALFGVIFMLVLLFSKILV